MKRHFVYALLFLTGFAFISCEKETEMPGIRISFLNKTGADIQDVVADSVVVGTIRANRQTGLIRFQRFGTDTGMPDSRFTGVQDGQIVESTSRFYFCGTEKSMLAEGRYVIEIEKKSVDGKPYFDLRFKR